MKKLINFFNCAAKSLQKTGGGDSQKNVHHLGVASEMPPRCLRDASVSIYSCQSDFSTRVWKYVACLLLAFVLGIGQMWATDLEETSLVSSNFASATERAYVGNQNCAITGEDCPAPFTELYMYKSSNCDVAVNSASGGGSRKVSGKLQAYLNNTSKKWSWVRSSNLATTAPEVLHIKAVMLFDKTLAGSAGNTMCIAVGNGFEDGMQAYPAATNVVAGFSFNGGNTKINKYNAYGTAISGSKEFSNNTEFTLDWYINNSASKISYTDPNGTSHELAAGCFDIWVDKVLFCDAVDKATNGVSGTTMQNLYIGSNGSSTKKHEFVLSSINIYSLSAGSGGGGGGEDPEPSCGETEQAALELSESSGTICGTGTTTFTVSGGSGEGTLSVSTSDNTKATATIDGTTVTVTGVAAGSATITVTKACDATYAEKSATFSATVAAIPTANAGADKTTEPGEGVALAATGAADGCTGAWTIQSGPNTSTDQLSSTSSATATFTPTAAGTYTLRWTVTNSTSSCSAYDEMTVTAVVCSISECGNANITYVIKVGSSGSQATDGSDFITSATPSDPTALGASTTVGLNTITISDGTMKAAAATNACYSSKPNMTGKIGVYNGASYSASNYLQFAFTVKSGYTFTPCDIRLVVQPVDVATSFRWEVTDGENIYGYGTETNVPKGSDGGASVLMGLTSTAEMEAGDYYIRLYPYVSAASKTFRLGTDVVLKGTVAEAAAPESSDCSAFEFHYGPEIGDWETACFTQVGETNEWRIEDFTVPSTGNYYVGYHGDGVNGWNSTWSANKSWTDSYSEGNGAMVLLPGTSAVGQATGAQGTLIIWSNSGDKNKYVGFKPNGYGITYGGNSHAFATTETANVWETGVVTLPDVSTTYTMGLATATEGTYVSCAHSAAAEAISNMSVSNVDGGKKKVYLYTEDAGWLDKNPKMAVYDYTAGHACWGDGTEATKFMTKVNDNLWYGYVQSDATNLIMVRVNPDNDNPAWDWGQSQNITLNSADSYDTYITLSGWSGDPSKANFTKGFAHPATGQKGKFRMWDNSSAQNWYVNFVPYYTLSYDGNGASGSTAAAERCAESSTLTVTVADNGFTVPGGKLFAGWAISQEHADAGTVDYEAGDDYTLTSDATLYAVWESNCPTTGTLFTLSNVGSGYSNNSDAETELTNITLSGGTAYGFGTSDRALEYKSNKIKYNGNANYIKLVLDCPLQVGDEISVTCDEETGLNFNTDPSTGLGNNGSHPTYVLNGGTYEVKAEDGIIGESTIICWRRTSNGTNVTAITITRPIRYDVTYYKNDGTETSTLAEDVTKVAANEFVRSGYQFTGWNTDPAGEGTAYAVGASLSSDLTLYAQWAELYTITTGSPANGTVEADKESAVAGATITLTATPASGYKLSAWDVYKTGDASTKVSVTNDQFTMPAYGVTISASFVESVVLYDYSVMDNKSFTNETVDGNGSNKDKTFGSEGNPQLIITKAGWDKKDNLINSFIKFFGGTSSMSVVIPTGRKATVAIKYGSYDASGKYLLVNGTAQAKPVANMSDGMTAETFGNYMRTVELTNQTGTLALTASTGNIYIAYVDVTLTGYASYGVTYHLNDGAWDGDAGAATYTYGTGIATLATNVTKNGYDFAGWYGNEGLTGDAITSIANNVTGDKEVWAAWTPKSYTLTWSWDGGACSGVAGTNYTAGGSVAFGTALVYPEASMMSKDGAAFAGWSTSAATMPAEALTITALWAPEHAITYKETKGATNTNPETYVQGVGVASFAPLADVANFHFTGWSPTSIGTDATEDMDVTAQWVAAYNVSFSAGEGSGTVPATFQKWATATFELPGQGEMVAPAGKVFVGWKANGAGEPRAAGYEYTMTAAAVEFVAQWKNVILLIKNDGSLNTTNFQTDVDVVDGVAASGYAKQAKVKNNISGMSNFDNLGKGVIYHTTTNSTKVTIAMYNNYSSNSTSTAYYVVVPEGTTSLPSATSMVVNKNEGKTYEVNMTGRSTLYVFSNQKELRISQITVEENGTANKVAPEVGYSVNLNKQRPMLLSGDATTFEGITYKVPSNYKPVYAQIQIKSCGTDYYSFTIPESQTRQLQLTTSNTEKYVVSKTLGDNTESKKVSGNQNINLTAGTWYINPQGSNINITTIAFAATPDPITVTFNSNGGSAVDDQALFAGDKVTAPTAPTKSGYRFVGWQKSGVDYDFATTLVAGDAPGFTLDAVWQQVWTVTFDSDGGSDVAEAIVDAGLTVAQPADPTKAGHAFDYWYKVTGEEGQEDVAYVFSTAVAADMTLKAHWHELQNDPSLGSLSYDGNAIELSSGVESEGVITYTYELPYNVNYTAGKLVPVPAAGTATLSDITYTSGTKTASFTVTTADGPEVQNYAVVFTNAPKDQLCLVWAEMTADNTLTLDEDKSYLDIEVTAAGGVKEETTKQEYQGYTGYKFRSNGSYTELKDGNFKSGDKVDVFVVAAIGDKMRVYSANEAIDDNIVAISENNMVQGHNPVTLTADAASLYLRRGDGEETYKGWNPHIAYIAVYRAYPVPVVKTITFNGVAGAIDGTTITATIPYTTNMASLPIEATFMSNDPSATSGDVGGPWAEVSDGVYTNSYVVTDKDGDTNTYTITLTRATVSHDASLTALAVEGYEISFAPATLSYDVQLPYGATVGDLPAVTYTAAPAATADKTDAAEMPGYTTITVTAEDGTTVQEYSIYFHANQIPSIVIYDGTTEMEFATESNSQLVTWTSVDAGTTIQNSGATINNKEYAHNVKVFGGQTSASRNMDIVIPADYMAKFYLAACSNSDSEADIYITKDAVGAKADAVVSVSGDRTQPAWSESDFVAPGHYFLNATNSTRLYELSVTLYHIDYTRSVTEGRIGTICLPKGGTIRGAAVYEVAYFNPDNQKIYYDEVLSGEMEPGMPYVFMPDEGNNDQLVVMCGNNVPAAVAGNKNGLYGSFTQELLTKDDGNYIFSANKYWFVNSDEVYVGENRAYLKVADIYGYNNEPIPPVAHGRRRISMDAGAHAPQVTTGVESISDEGLEMKGAQKMLINGKIYILRGEKMYDATGRLVK